MVHRPTGRERPFSILLNNYPFPVVMQNGVPLWQVERVPDIEGQTSGVQDREQAYRSTHSGFGWSQQVAPNTYHYCDRMDARYPGQIIMGPRLLPIAQAKKDSTTGITGFFEISSKIYTISGKYVNEIDPTTLAVTDNATFPYDLTTVATGAVGTVGVRFDGNVIIGMTTASGASMVSFNGTTTFTALNDSAPSPGLPKGAYLVRYQGDTDWNLACVALINSNPSWAWLAQGADTTDAENWTGYGGAYGVGDQSASITGLTAAGRTLYASLTDGLYRLSGQDQRAPVLIPAIPVSSTNGLNTTVTPEGNILFPCQSGLYLYDEANETIEDISPGRGLPDRSGIFGRCTALAVFRSWIYASIYDGTHSYIMAGRRREQGEPGFGSYIWHGAIARVASQRVTSMHLSTLTSSPTLWLGMLTGNPIYMYLPSNGDNPLLDTNMRYAKQGSIYFPADDFSGGGMYWNLQDVAIEVEGMDDGSTITIYERRDRGSWVILGSVAGNGRHVIQTTGDHRFTRNELRLDVANGSYSTTPVIRVLVGKASRRPVLRDVISTTVACYDEALSRQGIQSRYTGETLVDQLKSMDESAPVELRDWWTGREQVNSVLVMPGRRRIVRQQGDDAGGLAVDLVMKVLILHGWLLTEASEHLTTEAGVNLELE